MSGYWESKYFQAKPVTYLPLRCDIKDRAFTVSRLKLTELPAVYDIVTDAVEREDNVGVDEYPDLESFLSEMALMEAFSIKESSVLVGALFTGNRVTARNRDTAVCEFNIFLHTELFRAGFHKEFVLLAERMTRDLQLGYFIASAMVFESNWEIIRDLRSVGYIQCLTLPNDGRLKKLGQQQTWMLVKTIDAIRELRPMADILSLLDTEHFRMDPDPAPPRTDALPVSWWFKHAGISAIFRWAEPAEYRHVYDMIQSAGDEGDGYSSDECLTFDEFLKYYMNGNYNAVLEEKGGSGRILAYLSYGTRDGYKGRTPTVCHGSVVVARELRGSRLGSEFTVPIMSWLRSLGYETLFDDTLMINRRMRTLQGRDRDVLPRGVIPCGCWVPGAGWTDEVICCRNIKNMPHFPDLVRENHKQYIMSIKSNI